MKFQKKHSVKLAALILAIVLGVGSIPFAGPAAEVQAADNAASALNPKAAVAGVENSTVVESGDANAPKNGWDAAKKHYYEKGKMVVGKKKIGHHWYYFNKKGVVQKSKFVFFKKQNKICYYDENGWAVKGAKKIGKYYYYFRNNYALTTNEFVTFTKKNRTCYYNSYGRRVYGLKKIKKNYYLFQKGTGAMLKGFQKVTRNGKTYTCYFNSKGRMLMGEEKLIKGTLYSFDKATGKVESMLIAHASGDENGDYYNGRAGDQTGTEVCVRSWYNRPWNCVLRAKSANMREKIATAMERAAANNNIGYDMNDRNTLYYQAKALGWDPGSVTQLCETDCSALVSLACMYAGIPSSLLFQEGNSSVTWNLRRRLESTGKFQTFTSTAYIQKTSKLVRGDILLYEGHHTAVVTGRKKF